MFEYRVRRSRLLEARRSHRTGGEREHGAPGVDCYLGITSVEGRPGAGAPLTTNVATPLAPATREMLPPPDWWYVRAET